MKNSRSIKIALLGNPNSGKTSLFNRLTGLNQRTGNFPGVTVDKKTGFFKISDDLKATITDLPGTYSLYPRSEDQKIVLRILLDKQNDLHPDLILYVADAGNLDRHLLLMTQIMDLGIPLILCLNMVEKAEQGASEVYDTNLLAEALQIPVCKVNARTTQGLEELRKLIHTNTDGTSAKFTDIREIAPYLIEDVKGICNIESDLQALLTAHHVEDLPHLNEVTKNAIIDCKKAREYKNIRVEVADITKRYEKVRELIKDTSTRSGLDGSLTFTSKLDTILTHKIFGTGIFFLILFAMFQAIFSWAELPMEWIDLGIAAAAGSLNSVMPEGILRGLLTEGIIPGLGGILIFIPQITILFTLIAVLEETGYMARAVYLSDRLMQKFGMNGRSLVALISGAACAVPAVMSARTISNSKERLITIFVTPFITCSARIPVFVVLTAFAVPAKTVLGFINLQGLAMLFLYFVGTAAALASAYILKKIIKSKELSFLMMELPEYKMPDFKNALITVVEKVRIFVFEAGKIILAISIVLWFLASFGPGDSMDSAKSLVLQELSEDADDLDDRIAAARLQASYAGILGKVIEPVIIPLGFDWKIGIALISSFAAREVFVSTMATIYSVGSADDENTIIGRMREAKNPQTGEMVYNPATAFSLLIFYALAMQCMSTLAVVYRETKSWKIPLMQLLYMTGLAYLASWITFNLLK